MPAFRGTWLGRPWMHSFGVLELCISLLISLYPPRVAGLYDPVNRIESARLYGNIDHYAYYFVDILVGTPPQRVSLILDTGSGLAGFPCKNCGHCGKHIDPNFDFAKSSTAKWKPCSKCQGRCRNGKCYYHQGYQEGSSISGFWFQDWVRLGDSIQRNPPVFTDVGCHSDENRLFYTQKANGILGIRGANTLLERLFQDKQSVDQRVFALCLAEWGGRLVVGGYNASYHTGDIQWIPVQPSSYGVSLTSMRVADGAPFADFRHAVIDSGTTYTYMGRGPYKALRSGIENYCRQRQGCGAKQQGSCWTVKGLYEGLKEFPKVEVQFGKVRTVWEPRAYLYRKGSGQSFCYSFEDDGPGASTVLGSSWMLYKELVFDLRTSKVGIVEANCPEYRKRPDHSTANLDPPTVPPSLRPSTTPAFEVAGTSPAQNASLQPGTGAAANPGDGAGPQLIPAEELFSWGALLKIGSAAIFILVSVICCARRWVPWSRKSTVIIPQPVPQADTEADTEAQADAQVEAQVIGVEAAEPGEGQRPTWPLE